MRLDILNRGYKFGTKILFSVIKLFSGYPLPDAARLVFYRPDFYGNPAKRFTQQAMRGPSAWTVGDRELMAAYVSKHNECSFCIKAHAAVSAGAYGNRKQVDQILADIENPDISPSLRAMLLLLGKLTHEHTVNADDVTTVLETGVSPEQIEDAFAICFAFNVTNRLADAFGFHVPSEQAFEAGAKYLLKRGYA